MAAEIRLFPCLSDNFGYLIHDPSTGATASIDAPEAGPIIAALEHEGWTLTDILVMQGSASPHILSTPRLDTRHTHGTGCAFASAIATGLAQKIPMIESVNRAHAYVQDAIARAPGFGAGHGPLGH